jgi:hypothetical protein
MQPDGGLGELLGATLKTDRIRRKKDPQRSEDAPACTGRGQTAAFTLRDPGWRAPQRFAGLLQFIAKVRGAGSIYRYSQCKSHTMVQSGPRWL